MKKKIELCELDKWNFVLQPKTISCAKEYCRVCFWEKYINKIWMQGHYDNNTATRNVAIKPV